MPGSSLIWDPNVSNSLKKSSPKSEASCTTGALGLGTWIPLPWRIVRCVSWRSPWCRESMIVSPRSLDSISGFRSNIAEHVGWMLVIWSTNSASMCPAKSCSKIICSEKICKRCSFWWGEPKIAPANFEKLLKAFLVFLAVVSDIPWLLFGTLNKETN